MAEADPGFSFLATSRSAPEQPHQHKDGKSFSRNTKTAAYFEAALPGGTRCALCGSLVHRNSVQFDHIVAKREGGIAALSNAQVTHPFCNSIKEHLRATDEPTPGNSEAL